MLRTHILRDNNNSISFNYINKVSYFGIEWSNKYVIFGDSLNSENIPLHFFLFTKGKLLLIRNRAHIFLVMSKNRGGEITTPLFIGLNLIPFGCGMSSLVPCTPNPLKRDPMKTYQLLYAASTNSTPIRFG